MSTRQFDPGCRRCSRLADFLDRVKSENPGYFCRPVPPFGAQDPGLLVVGVVIVEVIFVYPGMGQYLVDHVSKRDVPVVQACGLVFAAVYIGLNMIADVVAILSNPRLRHPK